MKNKYSVYAIVLISISVTVILSVIGSFMVFSPSASEQSTFPAGAGFGFVASLALIIGLVPVFIMLSIGLTLVLKKHLQQKRSIAGNVLLWLVLIAIGIMWWIWQKDGTPEPFHLAFIPPVLPIIGVWLFLLVNSSAPKQ